jgi:hypothetical protein
LCPYEYQLPDLTFLQPKIATGSEHCSCERCVFDDGLVVATVFDKEEHLRPDDWTELDDKAHKIVGRTVGVDCLDGQNSSSRTTILPTEW